MKSMVLDKKFESIAVLDFFDSFIWTDRYYEAGDFEIYTPASVEMIKTLEEGNYIWRDDSEHLMIIKSVELDSDIEEGVHLLVKGESLESILKRRVTWQTTLEGSIQDGIKKLLDENIISPESQKRRIKNFSFVYSNDKVVQGLKFDAPISYSGENLYDVIVEICTAYGLGFKITLNEKRKTFDFSLYMGKDRSYNQDWNPWVVFSPDFDNLSASSYYSTSEDYRNAAYIIGAELPEPGERLGDNPPIDPAPPTPQNNGVNRYHEVEYTDAVGLDRREIFVDASDIKDEEDCVVRDYDPNSWSDYDYIYIDATRSMSDETYFPQLEEKAKLELAGYQVTTAFEGMIETTQQYTYGRDFFIGDIVQITNEFGMTACSRISEIIRCYDVNGDTLTPTFIKVN